jgi:hypothetical protein
VIRVVLYTVRAVYSNIVMPLTVVPPLIPALVARMIICVSPCNMWRRLRCGDLPCLQHHYWYFCGSSIVVLLLLLDGVGGVLSLLLIEDKDGNGAGWQWGQINAPPPWRQLDSPLCPQFQ